MNSDPEYFALRESIIEKLKRVEHPATGGPIFKQIFPSENIYSGDFLSQGPDLVVVPRDGFAINDSLLPTNFMEESETMICGGHREDGIILVAGNGIMANANLKSACIIDVAPTILYCLGLPIPEDMDGEVLASVFKESYIGNNPVEYCEADAVRAVKLEDELYSRGEQGMVQKRLEELGYL